MINRVLSGIRATGRLHLGNYLGAVKGMIELQNNPNYETFYMVADVHAITTPYDVNELQKDRMEVVRDYLAAGLDPKKSTIFIQSMVPNHLELSFYLSSVISVARMQHLPTYKEKVKQHSDESSMALLNYPVLMAADIIAYKSNLVPVGKDQEPHLEIARQIARNMNERYGTNFPEPQVYSTSGKYVPSLLGEGKMSKSIEGSYINLTDSLEDIKATLSKVPTDSGKGIFDEASSSIQNLFSFVETFISADRKNDLIKGYESTGVRYGDLKKELAEAIFKTLEPIQERRSKITDQMVLDVINEGAKKATQVTSETLKEVKEKMGFSL
jgi:tryptophanyl-tRNA synthetase